MGTDPDFLRPAFIFAHECDLWPNWIESFSGLARPLRLGAGREVGGTLVYLKKLAPRRRDAEVSSPGRLASPFRSRR